MAPNSPRCHRLEKHLGMELYFADPGCPYQRGTNENTNGLIRQYFPKGTDFRDVSHSQVRQVENLLNNRPRAASGFELPVRFSSRKPLPAVAIEFGNRPTPDRAMVSVLFSMIDDARANAGYMSLDNLAIFMPVLDAYICEAAFAIAWSGVV